MAAVDEYDFIVVGAGAAGCALAARLSEDPTARVLLLEAGPSDRKLEVRLPAAFPKLFGSERDWAFETPPEPGLDGRRVFFPRGRTLGGSTSMNAMIYTRGHAADFAAMGDEGGPEWAPDEMARALARVEATISVQPLRDPNPLSRAFVRAARDADLPDDLGRPSERDGVGLVFVTQRRGRRFSAADAYLRPARRRANLRVRTRAEALALLWADHGRRVDGVVYRHDGLRRDVRARTVVLCAGAIGTPHLLLRSGVGPGEHLQAHGVRVRRALTGVGQNLVDHPMSPVVFSCRAPVSLKAAESPSQVLRYLLLRRGMLTSNVGEAVAFLRTRRTLDAPDLELVFAPVTWVGQGLERPTRHGFTIAPVALAPTSRGQVALASPDPGEPPAIRPRYLTDPADARVLADGVRLARRIAAHPAVQAFGDVAEQPPTADAERDEDLVASLREVTQTLYHPAGTCRMGAGAGAVVDPGLRVYGVDGLAVADASILPALPRAHPQAAVLAVAERAAELLRQPAHGAPVSVELVTSGARR